LANQELDLLLTVECLDFAKVEPACQSLINDALNGFRRKEYLWTNLHLKYNKGEET
jgi:hypothetical protein